MRLFRNGLLSGISALILSACSATESGIEQRMTDIYSTTDSNSEVYSSKDIQETEDPFEISYETCVQKNFFQDKDNDNTGNLLEMIISCEKPIGYVDNNFDCNDDDPTIYLTAKEICNGKDDNCNGIIDDNIEFFKQYADKDNDTFGDPNNMINDCKLILGYVKNNQDCDDNNPLINPSVLEICNSKDDNCNSLIDDGLFFSNYYLDKDNDSFGDKNGVSVYSCNGSPGFVKDNSDCDDNNAAINPIALEICNKIDDNCNAIIDDGLTYFNQYADKDGDGFGDISIYISDCKLNVGYSEDNTDCDDNNLLVNANALEICNNIDDNCNFEIDEKQTVACKTVCGDGLEECIDGIMKECTAPKPQPEICDGLDNDCNGAIDDKLNFIKWFIDQDGDGQGSNNQTKLDCKQPLGFVDNNYDCNDNDSGLKSGSVLWTSKDVQCSGKKNPYLALDINGNILVNDDNGYLYVINKDNGSLSWSNKNTSLNPVIGDNGNIYVKSGETKITAFNSSFKQVWEHVLPNCDDGWDISGGIYDMSISSSGTIYVSMAQVDWDVWADDYCRNIHAITKDGNEIWDKQLSTSNDLITGTSVGFGEIIHAALGPNLFTYYPNGTLISNVNLGKSFYFSSYPIFGKNGELYLLTPADNKLVAFNSKNNLLWSKEGYSTLPVIDAEGNLYTNKSAIKPDGKVLWSTFSDFSGSVVASNNTVYLFGPSGLYAVDSATGKQKWGTSIDTKTNNQIVPANLTVGDDGTLYFCNAANNQVHAVCATNQIDSNAAWPMLRHDNQRTGNFNNK